MCPSIARSYVCRDDRVLTLYSASRFPPREAYTGNASRRGRKEHGSAPNKQRRSARVCTEYWIASSFPLLVLPLVSKLGHATVAIVSSSNVPAALAIFTTGSIPDHKAKEPLRRSGGDCGFAIIVTCVGRLWVCEHSGLQPHRGRRVQPVGMWGVPLTRRQVC